jgi:hypothetical protein
MIKVQPRLASTVHIAAPLGAQLPPSLIKESRKLLDLSQWWKSALLWVAGVRDGLSGLSLQFEARHQPNRTKAFFLASLFWPFLEQGIRLIKV